jgi:Fe-S oxidoreductase
MSNNGMANVDVATIKRMIGRNKTKIKLSLKLCAHCALCAESCFLYQRHDQDPVYMPSHKVINSVGVLYRRKGRLDRADLIRIREIVWGRCVLCMRCYCPLGIDIPGMIAFARGVCRSQGVAPDFAREHAAKTPSVLQGL